MTGRVSSARLTELLALRPPMIIDPVKDHVLEALSIATAVFDLVRKLEVQDAAHELFYSWACETDDELNAVAVVGPFHVARVILGSTAETISAHLGGRSEELPIRDLQAMAAAAVA